MQFVMKRKFVFRFGIFQRFESLHFRSFEVTVLTHELTHSLLLISCKVCFQHFLIKYLHVSGIQCQEKILIYSGLAFLVNSETCFHTLKQQTFAQHTSTRLILSNCSSHLIAVTYKC